MKSVFLDAPQWQHAQVPSWFAEAQLQAWRDFARMSLPTRRDENWRFADLAKLKFDHFLEAPAVDSTDLIARSMGASETAGRLIFANDVLIHADESLAKLGIKVHTLAEGFESAKHAINGISSRLGSAKFLALHQAHLKNAVIIEAPESAVCEKPIEIFHWASGDNSTVFPRTIVLAHAGAKVVILEHHQSGDAHPHFSCGAAQIFAGREAQVEYALHQQWNFLSKAIHLSTTHCAHDSKVCHAQMNLGAAWNRTENVSHLEGSGARSDMISACISDGDQENDQRTLQLHHAPRTSSDLLYKNALFGKSRSIFAGLIAVDEGAHFTDAYQTCRNLLMSDECEANSMPGLEINADQVKCSHGSTSSAIRPDETFYLQSRGIPQKEAQSMLAEGFITQTLERLQNRNVAEFLAERVRLAFLRTAK